LFVKMPGGGGFLTTPRTTTSSPTLEGAKVMPQKNTRSSDQSQTKDESSNRKRKDARWLGEESEARFLVECLRRHWDVTKPFGHIHYYDFVIRLISHTWDTVQVKTAYIEYSRAGSKKLLIPLRRRNESRQVRYTEDDFDLMCAIDLPTDRIWLIPFGCLRYQNSNYSLRCAAPFLLGEGELDISDVAGLTEIAYIHRSCTGPDRRETGPAPLSFDASCNMPPFPPHP
jgi:hypothetical protein